MKNIRNKTEKELIKIVKENRDKIKNFRFGIAGSKIRNVKEGKNIKKQIARILTEINFRQKTKI